MDETKPSFKTTEFLAYLATIAGVLSASAVDETIDARLAWILVAALGIGYMLKPPRACQVGDRTTVREPTRISRENSRPTVFRQSRTTWKVESPDPATTLQSARGQAQITLYQLKAKLKAENPVEGPAQPDEHDSNAQHRTARDGRLTAPNPERQATEEHRGTDRWRRGENARQLSGRAQSSVRRIEYADDAGSRGSRPTLGAEGTDGTQPGVCRAA